MTLHAHLTNEIRQFLRLTGLSPRQLSMAACNEPHVVGRLLAGGNVTIKTAQRLLDFMATYDAKQRRTQVA